MSMGSGEQIPLPKIKMYYKALVNKDTGVMQR